MAEKDSKKPHKKQATPIEIGALLMEAVCIPASSEEPALADLAENLGTMRGRMKTELLLLRAFAVDFALDMSLGDSPARWAIAEQYYGHWEHIGEKIDAETIDSLEERLKFYTEVVSSSHVDSAGLTEQVGMAFAARCISSDVNGLEELSEADERVELAMLGGSMFVALFDECSDLLTQIEIVLLDSQ